LPVDLIGRPFSQKTRDHFLPLLTSTKWWSQTQLALRRVFQLDPDFQERMFARQIAVMKGQAWNVVETLKTADHGPLELTRRAKVCVWDDLVDVPIAVPMRATSSEMRRRAEAELAQAIEEEMDIGAPGTGSDSSRTVAPQTVDLLGLTSPPADLPNPGRFEIASLSSAADDSSSPKNSESEQASPLANGTGSGGSGSALVSAPSEPIGQDAGKRNAATGRPPLPHSSLSQGPPRSLNMYSPERWGDRDHQRRFSFTTAAGRRESNSIAAQLYGAGAGGSSTAAAAQLNDYIGFNYYDEDDGLEGDLGYAAAEGMEGNQRKVIVERLEPVKTRNPVFTWC
jgi:phosphatidylinositol 4-kinase type 2